jgi:hypothetical protein
VIVVFGRRLYGKVDSADGVFVRTSFFHIMWVPLVPLGSYLGIGSKGETGYVRVPLQPRSVLAAYLRAGSVAAVLVLVAVATREASLSASFMAGFTPFAVLLTFMAWGFIGRPSSEARAQRRVYAEYAGNPVDVGLVARAAGHGTNPGVDGWLAQTTARAQAAFASAATDHEASYRDAGRFGDWKQAAARPRAASPACRRAALTLARIAWAQSKGPARVEAARAHAALWAALAAEPARAGA